MIEVEQWKIETAEAYQKQLSAKDTEIRELRETLSLLTSRKASTAEEDVLVNQLLDYLSSEGKEGEQQVQPQQKPAQSATTTATTTEEQPQANEPRKLKVNTNG